MQLTTEAILHRVFAVLIVVSGLVMCTVGTGFVRFHVPKEIALQLMVLCAIIVTAARRRVRPDRIDLALFAALLLQLPSLLAVHSWEAAARFGSLTLGLGVLFTALRRTDNPAAAGIVLAFLLAVSGLGEAVGLWSFSPTHFAPGGFTGQRNHLAHALVPALALIAARPKASRVATWTHVAAAALFCAVIVLTRCRTAYLAAIAVALFSLPQMRIHGRGAGRWLIGALLGIAISPLLDASLHWTDKNPYMDSLLRLFELSRGSGAMRIDETAATLRLFKENLVLGIGPGQWSSAYLTAAEAKALLHFQDSGTVTRLAHCDAAARLSETGILGAAGALVFVVTVLQVLRARNALSGALPFLAALSIIELLDAGISIPSTGISVAVCAAALLPRIEAETLAPNLSRRRFPFFGVFATWTLLSSFFALVILSRVLAADRVFALSDDPAALVSACEQDPTNAAHCINAFRRAATVLDCSNARRAASVFSRQYPKHPLVPDILYKTTTCRDQRPIDMHRLRDETPETTRGTASVPPSCEGSEPNETN